MKITTLEKKKRLYLLETDTKQKIYITEDTIVRFFLSKDKEISEQEFQEIQTFAQFSYGKNLALYHLSFKRRTKKEVRDYLASHDIAPEASTSILNELEKENWLNDRAYAETLLEQNQHSGDKGPLHLQQKLTQKGIDKDIISELLAHQDFTSIAEKVAQKIKKKYQNKLPSKALKDKIIQHLINKGFSYQQGKESLSHVPFETDQEQEEDLLYRELDKQLRKYQKKYDGYELNQRLTQALARKGYDYDQIKSALRDYM